MERDSEGILWCRNCCEKGSDVIVVDNMHKHLELVHGWYAMDAVRVLNNSINEDDGS